MKEDGKCAYRLSLLCRMSCLRIALRALLTANPHRGVSVESALQVTAALR